MTSLIFPVHLAAALLGLVLGAVMLLRAKGDAPHRLLGRLWVAIMVVVALTSFGITKNGHLSWIHGLSVITLISLVGGVWSIRRGNRRGHLAFMAGAYLGLVGAFAGTLAPGRFFGDFLWR